MSEENVQLQNLLLDLFQNNPVFRDNLEFLSQVQLRNLSSQFLPEFLMHVEDTCKYIKLSPPRSIC